MLETVHVAVGVGIALSSPNPSLTLPLAFASHFVLDMVPHWNPHTYTETKKFGRPSNKTIFITAVDIIFSLILGLGVAYLLLPNTYLAILVLAASFLAVLPDITKYPYFMFKSLRKGVYKKWVDYERSLQNDVALIPGSLTQIIILASALWWIFG